MGQGGILGFWGQRYLVPDRALVRAQAEWGLCLSQGFIWCKLRVESRAVATLSCLVPGEVWADNVTQDLCALEAVRTAELCCGDGDLGTRGGQRCGGWSPRDSLLPHQVSDTHRAGDHSAALWLILFQDKPHGHLVSLPLFTAREHGHLWVLTENKVLCLVHQGITNLSPPYYPVRDVS